MGTFEEGAMVFGDIWGIELGQNLDFLLNILDLIFCALKVSDLYRDGLLGPFVETMDMSVGGERRESGSRVIGWTYPL